MKITSKRTVRKNHELIWPHISNFANICDYHPMIKRSYTKLQPNSRKLGAIRHCDLNRGKFIEEKLIEFEEGSHYVAELYDSNFPIKAAETTFKVEKIDEHSSEISITMEMGTEYLIMKPLMYMMFKFIALPGLLKNVQKAAMSSEPKGSAMLSTATHSDI